MKKLFTLLFAASLAVSGCDKKCDTYHVKSGDDCVTWSSRIDGDWEIIEHTFPNAVGYIWTCEEKQANTFLIDGSILAQMIDENNYEVPEQTMQGPDGPYQYRAWGTYSEASTPIYGNSGQITGYNVIKTMTFNADNSSPEIIHIKLKHK